ncbi:hypothetical protein ACIQF6_26170 [Kitasatospora sp. NPDC092948]|uniref:hypothetical protein n=1 Tax=Kitasatospora sp. NPDC092948 TaxID=3364088 RepID=UPI0037F29BC8
MTAVPRKRVAALLAALPLAALVWTAVQAPPAAARTASACGDAVERTRQDLANAGAPTDDTDWQDVRNDAQQFLDDHPWDGPATEALKRDINALDAYCAP